MICDCGGVMIYDGECWECFECGATFMDEDFEEVYDGDYDGD